MQHCSIPTCLRNHYTWHNTRLLGTDSTHVVTEEKSRLKCGLIRPCGSVSKGLICLQIGCLINRAVQVRLTQGYTCTNAQKSGRLTEKSLVIICSVTWKTASKIFGTSFCIRSLSLLMMAAKRLSTSASLHTNTGLIPYHTQAVDKTQNYVSLTTKKTVYTGPLLTT